MKSFWKTFGHEQVKSILNKQLAAKKFPHAYLFVGPESVGKLTLAKEFASKILDAANLDTNPDFQVANANKEINVEQFRDFLVSLNFKPFSGERKVAIIDNFDSLNSQSSNALLKTLEEPSVSTILILIAHSRFVLPTIVSRCQTFNFNKFTLKQLEGYAQSQGLSADNEVLAISYGSPGVLQRFLNEKSLLEQKQEELANLSKIESESAAERLLQIKELAELEDLQLKSLLDLWLAHKSTELLNKAHGYKTIQAILDALKALKTNKNRKLILQGLFLRI